jgi:hypothetical protein
MKTLRVLFLFFIVCASTPVLAGIAMGASVIMKMQVENPSKTDNQTVPVKVYLPKEVSPKDIIDLGDLKLDYDPETGMYFVYNSVDLEPGQSIVKKVEMADVWVFTEEQMNSFVKEAKEMASQLAGTPYAAEASAIVIGIEEKVQGILKRQEETAERPSEHIRAYRQGISLINTIRQDVTALERLKQDTSGGEDQLKGPDSKNSLAGLGNSDSRIPLLGSGGAPEGGAPLGRSISMTAAWRIIFAILGFLGILSGVFFMTWHRLLSKQQGMPPQELEEAENKFDLLDSNDTESQQPKEPSKANV